MNRTSESSLYELTRDRAPVTFMGMSIHRDESGIGLNLGPAKFYLHLRFSIAFILLYKSPTHYVSDDSGYVVSSSAGVNTTPTTQVTGRAGFYPYDGGANVPATLVGLSARLQLGLIYFNVGQSDDQLSEVIQISVGNSIEGDPTELSQGYSITPILESEFFGLAPPNFLNCSIRVISTLDGKSQFTDDIPQITSEQRGMRHYSCSTIGIWHVLELSADNPGEAFQLNALSITAAYAGKLA